MPATGNVGFGAVLSGTIKVPGASGLFVLRILTGIPFLYTLGKKAADVFADVASGDLSRVTGWLKEKIHSHASFKKPGVLFKEVCGEFDASYYTDYLTKKFTELYEL